MKCVWLRMIVSVTQDLCSIKVRSHKDALIYSETGSHTSNLPALNSSLLAMPIDPQVSAVYTRRLHVAKHAHLKKLPAYPPLASVEQIILKEKIGRAHV